MNLLPFCYRLNNLLSTNFWHAQWDYLYLSSLLFINFQTSSHTVMASKKIQFDNPLFKKSEENPTTNQSSSSNSDTRYNRSMTRGTKGLAELYMQVTSMSQSTPVFNTSDSKKMHVASTTLGASEDVASLVNKVLSQPVLSQTSSTNPDAPIIEEVDASSDESEFSFPESTPMSRLRDSPHSISSTVMPIMMTNTTSMEEQVSIMAKTLE